MSGGIPPWAYAVGACLIILALTTGMWVGWGRGWAHREEELGWEREQAKARRVHPVYRVRPPEVAHDLYLDQTSGWDRHVSQALEVARPAEVAHERIWPRVEYRPAQIPGIGTPIWATTHSGLDVAEKLDTRTDEEFVADMAASTSAWLDTMLNANPVREDL